MAIMATSHLCAFADEIPSDINALYLVGEASPSGWNLGEAPELNNDGNGIFTWTGTLSTGQFKFTTARDNWNSIVSSVQDNATMEIGQHMGLTYNPESGSQDWKWYNNEAGDYTLTVNLTAETLTVVRAMSDITALYIIGSALSTWDRGEAPELTSDGNGVFSWTGDMAAGEFKFITTRDNWNSVVAVEPDKAVDLGQTMSIALNPDGGDKDYKWTIAEAGKYNVTVNIDNMTMVVTKVNPSAIESVAADASSEAVYYTLTGVKVENPVSGVYVRISGGVASKVKF